VTAKVNCSICGKLTDPSLENCPHCGSPVAVGQRVASPPVAAPAPITGAEQCPSCGAPVQDGDIVCVRCGVNLLTGHQVANKQHQESPAPPAGKGPYVLGAAAVILILIAGVLAFVVLRDPVHNARQKARSGDVIGAIGMLQKHTDNFPDSVEGFAALGRLYWQTQQYADASSAFETASRLRPSDEDLASMAVLAAGKIPGDAGRGRQLSALKRMAENHPGNAQTQKMLALAAGASGDYGASEEGLSSWASRSGNPEEAATYRGIVSALRGDYDAARRALESPAEPDSDTRLAQGYLASLSGDQARAAAALAEALAASPGDDAAAASRLGLLYMAQGSFDKALPLLRPAQVGVQSDSARFFYALCLETSGLGDDALMEYDRLVSGGGPFAEDSAVQMAILYAARGQLDRAEESIRKAKTFGTSPRLYTIEGQVAARQGDLARAQDSFRRAIQEDGDYPAAHLEQGLAYVRRGALSEGVKELEKYLLLADGTIRGGRVNEVDLLVKQLQQALDRGRGDTAAASRQGS